MQNSSTYQAILKEGIKQGEGRAELRTLREMLIELGCLRLGPPPAEIETLIHEEQSAITLRLLLQRLMSAVSWEELRPQA